MDGWQPGYGESSTEVVSIDGDELEVLGPRRTTLEDGPTGSCFKRPLREYLNSIGLMEIESLACQESISPDF